MIGSLVKIFNNNSGLKYKTSTETSYAKDKENDNMSS